MPKRNAHQVASTAGERDKAELSLRHRRHDYGEDPSEGFCARTAPSSTPKLGFTFVAPEDLRSTIRAGRSGVREGGGQALR